MAEKIDAFELEYLNKKKDYEALIHEIEQERVTKLFTLEKAKEQYSEDIFIKWTDDLEGEEMKIYGLSNNKENIFITTIHIDALWEHTWEHMDYSCVSETWLSVEEVNHFKKLLED